MWKEVWIVCVLVTTAIAVSRPPGMIIEPDFDVYYKAYETVKLPCVAEGDPRPSYYWQRNEIDFNPSGNDVRIVQLPNVGSLVFNSPQDKDEGIYQCFAKNDFGISCTKNINFREAKLEDFAFQEPTRHYPRLGQPYTLPCVPPESIPPASVFWITKSVLGGIDVLNYDDRVSVDRDYRLRFTNIKPQDYKDGMPYACVAMNNIMRRNSQGPLHYIQPSGTTEDYMPVELLWSDQDDRFGLRGQTLTIKCIFSGNPTPDVHWERPDNQTLPDRAKIKSFAQELEITNLQFEDQGAYECWATNPVSQNRRQRTFNIRVESKAYIIQAPEDEELGVGSTAEFTCKAGGIPPPRIIWYINGVELKAVTDPRIKGPRFKRPLRDKIMLENVEQTDHMVIQCNATNKHGYEFVDVYLNVLAEAPTILTPPEAKKVSAEGQPVNLTCRTTGKPDPRITWYKNGEQITGGRYQILLTGDLHIRAVVLADAGHYKCEAQNKFNVTSAEGTLVVRRKTRVEQKPLDLESTAGKDAKFTCSGTTDPEEVNNLRVEWQKDGKYITANDQRMTTNIQDNSLTISGTIQRDSGTYTCIVTNNLDEDKASAVLTVRDKPDPPTNVYHEWCNENATVHWMPGSYNNAPVQYFLLQYNTSFTPDKWNFGLKVNSTLTKVNMTLSPYVNYTFRVIAYNKIGESDPSAHSPVVCTTKPDRPFYHPRNLRTLGHQFGKLYIEWTPIPQEQQNGPGFYYILQILRAGAQAEAETINEAISDWRTNHYEMSVGLVYQAYKITLKAANSIGEAANDPSTIRGFSYEYIPEITPTNFVAVEVNDTSAVFNFDFDKREIGKDRTRIKGEFRGFKIQFWEENKRRETIREFDVGPESALNTTGNTFKAQVDDMLPNTYMMAQIAVRNNFYIGKPTEPIRFRTKPGLPGPVEYFRVINYGDTHVNLEWGAPLENRGDLIGYDISYQKVRGLDLGEMQEREPQINDPYTTNAYLSGLSPKSKYRVYIYARTEKGRGESYFIEIMTLKPGTPRMPRFTIADVGRKSINVSWWINAYAESGTIVFVEYRKLDGPEWLRTTDEVMNTWKTIKDLEPGTMYEIRIKATNGPISVASGIEEVRTDGTAKASDLVGNIGWFIGMLLSLILIIALIVVFVICYKRGFRFNQTKHPGTYYGSSGGGQEVYSGTYDNTARIDHTNDQFGPEPRGYNNDYYDDRDYHDYEGEPGYEKRPPSYNDHDYQRDNYRPSEREYEDYDRRPSAGYDPDFDNREPDKFDQSGYPREKERDYDGQYQDDYRDDYHDGRDDYYDGRDGYHDQQGYDYDDRRHDYRDDYDDDRRPAPSATPSSSTVV